jgi:uncharacterized repeat protein (TIGR03803 family)
MGISDIATPHPFRSVRRKIAYAVCILWVAAIAASAQNYQTVANFDGSGGGGANPWALVQGPDGNLYGTTYAGGINNVGTVSMLSATGNLTTIYSFCTQSNCTDGSFPAAGLVLGTDGYFYGTTRTGGLNGLGTVFRITTGGKLKVLHSCAVTDCEVPVTALVQATDGNFYGATSSGGTFGYGTIFRINRTGKVTILHSFDFTDGANPAAALVQGSDGNFYGTTPYGGSTACVLGCGTVFKITLAGTFTTLHSFDQTETYPYSELIQASDGSFYGTTQYGGDFGDGTIYRITNTGTLTLLHSFNSSEGMFPVYGLIQATDGNFYGTTVYGGPSNGGTIFSLTHSGTLTTLYSFLGYPSDGLRPTATLVQATSGVLFGTTAFGGTDDTGTVFSLSLGLSPFVKTLPSTGMVGSAVTILGTNLTGTTSVTFNGTSSTFTLVSPTLIKTTVPAGATTGRVQVETAGSTLTSSTVFRVK